jgi:hypothetical protein
VPNRKAFHGVKNVDIVAKHPNKLHHPKELQHVPLVEVEVRRCSIQVKDLRASKGFDQLYFSGWLVGKLNRIATATTLRAP